MSETQPPGALDKAAGESARALNLAGLAAPTILNFRSLFRYAEQQASGYAEAAPYPHIMIEDFIADSVVDSLLAEFPAQDEEINWRELHSENEEGDTVQAGKQGMPRIERLGPTIRELLWEMNSGSFLRFLEKLTGIENLIADPMLFGGGLHQVLPGGVLGVHADFTRHRLYDLDRRLNVLVYLNQDWQDDWGGDLELWATDMSSCKRRIRPLAGRCVVFTTTDDSYHGHPEPLACPDNYTRKSIALYYYSNGRPETEVSPTRATEWRVRPEVAPPEAE
jgi:Rps23 Pro-64 3,4-dihydroxylase Tpa1-like proline 4-hydroxylase